GGGWGGREGEVWAWRWEGTQGAAEGGGGPATTAKEGPVKDMPSMGSSGGISTEKSQHAFVMAGQQTLFLWHLTMLHMEEHEFELVLRASLTPDAEKAWEADRREHPDETYFLGNVETDLMT